jgi:hypothetical protein
MFSSVGLCPFFCLICGIFVVFVIGYKEGSEHRGVVLETKPVGVRHVRPRTPPTESAETRPFL